MSTTYYVATTGDDANDGTIGSPLKTLVEAGVRAQPGDTVYVRGGVYYTSLKVDGVKGTGPIKLDCNASADARIVFQAYPGEQPIIDGSQLGTTEQDLFQVRGQYYDIIGFELRNATKFAISMWRYNDDSGRHIRIMKNTIHDSWRGAVYPGKWSTHMHFEGNSVYHNVRANEALSEQCKGFGWQSAVNLTKSGDEVLNNLIYENWGEGIGIYGSDHHVAQNVLHDNFSVDLYVNNVMNSTIERNFVYSLDNALYHRYYYAENQGCPYPDGDPRCAECPPPGATHAAAIGIALANERPDAVQLDANRILNNIVVGPRRSGIQLSEWGTSGPAFMGTTIIANNTVVCAAAEFVFGLREPHSRIISEKRALVANNIFYQLRDGVPVSRAAGAALTDFASNNWFGGVLRLPIGCGSPTDVHGNPRLVNEHGVDAADFRLSDASPDIDQGTSLKGVVTDYFGTPRPEGRGFDIGAHELETGKNPR